MSSVLWHCWLSCRKGIWPVKNGGWWRWAQLSPDGVAPSRMIGVSASLNLPLHHKVHKFSSGTGSPGWSRKNGHKAVVMWWWIWHDPSCNLVTVMQPLPRALILEDRVMCPLLILQYITWGYTHLVQYLTLVRLPAPCWTLSPYIVVKKTEMTVFRLNSIPKLLAAGPFP